jgi:NADPH:quinone reductase-like Zn-dependent oxidoreductase
VLGGDVLQRSVALVRAGGTLVTIAEPPPVQPADGRAVFFVVETDRPQLAAIAQRLRAGSLVVDVGEVRPLPEAPAALGPDAPHVHGRTIIRVAEGW